MYLMRRKEKNKVKWNYLRNVINNILLIMIFINAGVGAMTLFGLKKGGVIHAVILMTLCLNIILQDQKVKRETKRVTAIIPLATVLMKRRIYGKLNNDKAYEVLSIAEYEKTGRMYVTYRELGEKVVYVERLASFLDSTHIILDLEKVEEKIKRKVER